MGLQESLRVPIPDWGHGRAERVETCGTAKVVDSPRTSSGVDAQGRYVELLGSRSVLQLESLATPILLTICLKAMHFHRLLERRLTFVKLHSSLYKGYRLTDSRRMKIKKSLTLEWRRRAAFVPIRAERRR